MLVKLNRVKISKSIHSKATFQESWLDSGKYKSLLAPVPSYKSIGRFILCKKDIYVSIMGVSALESHAAEKKHTNLVEEEKKVSRPIFQANTVQVIRYNRKYQARR